MSLIMYLVSFIGLMATGVLSGSADIDEALSLTWQIGPQSIDFVLTFNLSRYPESEWWAVSLSKDFVADIYRFNDTGVDGRYDSKECCAGVRMDWNEAEDGLYRTAFSRKLKGEDCCLQLEHGGVYQLQGLYGRYGAEGPVETRQTPKAVSVALTNQFTTREEMSPTLNYVVGLAAFMGLLYIAA